VKSAVTPGTLLTRQILAIDSWQANNAMANKVMFLMANEVLMVITEKRTILNPICEVRCPDANKVAYALL
jgi:hypothetical protein